MMTSSFRRRPESSSTYPWLRKAGLATRELRRIDQIKPLLDAIEPVDDPVVAHVLPGRRLRQMGNMLENRCLSDFNIGNARLDFAHIFFHCRQFGTERAKMFKHDVVDLVHPRIMPPAQAI